MARPRVAPERRFFTKFEVGQPPVDAPDLGPCWLWTGAIGSGGYGTLHLDVERGPVGAHRFSYELHVGPIPDGLQLDHLCRVKHCVNPLHLEAVTASENTLRAVPFRGPIRPRTHCKKGHPLSGDNVYGHNGKRTCKTCKADRQRAYRSGVLENQAAAS